MIKKTKSESGEKKKLRDKPVKGEMYTGSTTHLPKLCGSKNSNNHRV